MQNLDLQGQPLGQNPIYIGCAGWSIPKLYNEHFPADGSHLERYSARFSAVEINSSFYRPHRPQTYIKWAAAVPKEFRFAVKVPKSITHEHRLKNDVGLIETFLGEVAGLGDKLGPLLLQLPPSLAFNQSVSEAFFSAVRHRFSGSIICEPRHSSWFSIEANQQLVAFEVARVVADPLPVLEAGVGGWDGLAYYRLHGSPVMYRSTYSPEFLAELTAKIKHHWGQSVPTWCIFDNTAEFAATGNALELLQHLRAI